ncbi:MAG: hypothetical protein A3G39_02555 [Deltaproteobacteria bacterium RIFCSPLOWO2_12_FULL_43_16]|nr:MAG: hypothetical protein A2Z89_01065 [Deltaproteobacteria bacterium GWA2_43_19]OGQ09776.1 MAG: hypothetical protein A3D30_05580 [Deltaproteobacteria bacterium RIFCSPHIGHO2_02_FULL_43_33]OGQ33917.1 MAG: hypothetical protein A3A85_07395 [Deltaproteobacteria bacterium RIFCSPLOWO2_01_FULL_42_9]OGQ58931.1 MAG: hypothetical protein A3G39_02555 [Deltaproteobacteria bacterium RIFCSPLOWO2_12_FULL_43_16]HBR17700.1 hypothetical protein [Deltaproteobacteria bacterium]
MLREDEEFTKDSITNYLREILSEFTVKEGENPPDYYVCFGEKEIPLEITRCEPIYSLKNKIENRKTVEESLFNLCDEFNGRLKTQISKGVSLLLHIEGPVDKDKWKDFQKVIC